MVDPRPAGLAPPFRAWGADRPFHWAESGKRANCNAVDNANRLALEPHCGSAGRRSTGVVVHLPTCKRLAVGNQRAEINDERTAPSQQSAIRNQKSALLHSQSAIRNSKSTLLHPQSKIRNPKSALLHPQFAIHNPKFLS